MNQPPARRPIVRGALFHCLRVGLLAVILLLMHRQHQRLLATQRAAGLDQIPLSVFQSLFASATGLGEADPLGGRIVLAEDEPLGSVLQTFPEAQKFLGFSGPTNTLIGFDRAGKIIGLSILSSLDTRDHVDLISRDPRFLASLNGMDSAQASSAKVDAVSGATLTSLAILQGIQARLGTDARSLKFPDDYTLDDARRIFPEAGAVERDRLAPELWLVSNEKGEPIGYLLSNSPAADEVVGYQGPTRAFLGMQLDGTIHGLIVTDSYDNEPYVDDVRSDRWFAKSLNGKLLDDLADLTLEETRIEGVSGATMTSQAVIEGLLRAATKISERRAQEQQAEGQSAQMRWRVATTLGLIAIGLLIGLTQLRSRTWFRRTYQVALIGVMGLINGDLLSMAMFVGWGQSGIPWGNALGLVALAAAAIMLPVAAGKNVYCDHLCPHGAVQQLLPRHWQLKYRPRWLVTLLMTIRPVLLGIVVIVPLVHWRFSLVDIEPFDAYAWRAAGAATLCIAIGGIVLSLFLPMGYCRYGCPTGAVLGYLRRHSRSGEFSQADAVACVLLMLAAGCFWWGA